MALAAAGVDPLQIREALYLCTINLNISLSVNKITKLRVTCTITGFYTSGYKFLLCSCSQFTVWLNFINNYVIKLFTVYIQSANI